MKPSAPSVSDNPKVACRSRSWVSVCRQAAWVTIGSCVIGLAFNAARTDRLAWVQTDPYAILVPCPEPVGDAEPINHNDARLSDGRSFVIDVRSAQEYASWHIEGAQNQPFDWLGPPVDEQVNQIARNVAASRAQRVVVYGDGDNPDSGQEWAKLLSGARIKNVFFVRGGAPALNAALSKPIPILPTVDDPSSELEIGTRDSQPDEWTDETQDNFGNKQRQVASAAVLQADELSEPDAALQQSDAKSDVKAVSTDAQMDPQSENTP